MCSSCKKRVLIYANIKPINAKFSVGDNNQKINCMWTIIKLFFCFLLLLSLLWQTNHAYSLCDVRVQMKPWWTVDQCWTLWALRITQTWPWTCSTLWVSLFMSFQLSMQKEQPSSAEAVSNTFPRHFFPPFCSREICEEGARAWGRPPTLWRHGQAAAGIPGCSSGQGRIQTFLQSLLSLQCLRARPAPFR